MSWSDKEAREVATLIDKQLKAIYATRGARKPVKEMIPDPEFGMVERLSLNDKAKAVINSDPVTKNRLDELMRKR